MPLSLNSRAAIFTILALVSAASFLDFLIYRLRSSRPWISLHLLDVIRHPIATQRPLFFGTMPQTVYLKNSANDTSTNPDPESAQAPARISRADALAFRLVMRSV